MREHSFDKTEVEGDIRMRVPVTFLVLTLFLATGCEVGPTHYWYQPGKTFKQAKKDYRQCESRAKEAAADDQSDRARSSDDDADGAGSRYVFEGCMQGKGYLKIRDYRLPVDARKKSYSMGGIAGR